MSNTETITPELEPIGSTSALEAVQRAEIDIQIATAKRFPRNLSKVRSDMKAFAGLDKETAEGCFYKIPRGNKKIEGPTIRLAEIAISCYMNLRAGSRVMQVVSDGKSPHVVIQAVAHDLEKNVAITIEKRRRIVGKKSKQGRIDDDDINLAANAGSAIALRDAVFKVIPMALIKPVFAHARKIAVGDQATLSERRGKCLASFSKMGIDEDRILQHLSKQSAEDIGLEDLGDLIGIHNAIRDGEVKIDDVFPEQKSQGFAFKSKERRPTTGPKELHERVSDLMQTTPYDESMLIAMLQGKKLEGKKLAGEQVTQVIELSEATLDWVLNNADVVTGQLAIDAKVKQ